MIGQRHYVITRTDLDRPQYWRSPSNSRHGWVYHLLTCRQYKRPEDALRAARQIEVDPGITLEVVELETVVSRVCYRIETHEILENMPDVPPLS